MFFLQGSLEQQQPILMTVEGDAQPRVLLEPVVRDRPQDRRMQVAVEGRPS